MVETTLEAPRTERAAPSDSLPADSAPSVDSAPALDSALSADSGPSVYDPAVMTDSPERSPVGILVLLVLVPILGIQFVLGFSGFDAPQTGLMRALGAPGILLGWGGVLVVAILLTWLVLGWWGRNLSGLQALSSLTFRLLGCITLGVAVAGLLGQAGGARLGGQVGASLADLLGVLSGPGATLLLLLMTVPSLWLALSPIAGAWEPAVPRRPSADELIRQEPPSSAFESSESDFGPPPAPVKTTYPLPQYDGSGVEVPMTFGGRDVGPVRYAGDEEEPAYDEAGAGSAALVTPPPEPASVDDLPNGIRFADEHSSGAGSDDELGLVEPGDDRIPLPPGVRYADTDEEEAAEALEALEAEEMEEEPAAEADEETAVLEAAGDVEAEEDEYEVEEEGEEEYEDGQAYAEDEVEEEEEDDESLDEDVEVTPPVMAEPPPEPSAALALEALRDEDSGARYRQKLEGSGIFDEPAAVRAPEPAVDEKAEPEPELQVEDEADVEVEEPTAEVAQPKKVKKAKKATPKKKAKSRKKAAPEPKAAAAAKKTAAPKKKGAAKKAPAKKASAKKSTTKKAKATGGSKATKKTPTARKGAKSVAKGDPLVARAVEVALERGAASSVLFSRRLGIGYAQARKLVDTLVDEGILGDMAPSGSRPVLITEEAWKARR